LEGDWRVSVVVEGKGRDGVVLVVIGFPPVYGLGSLKVYRGGWGLARNSSYFVRVLQTLGRRRDK
jgi:hypothetical protein